MEAWAAVDEALPDNGDPPDLAEWGLHCYCPEAVNTPHRVISSGHSGRLLYLARDGAFPDQLGATDEQLAELIEFDLLEAHGDVVRTAFPVIGSRRMSALRSHVHSIAAPILEAIEAPARRLGEELDRLGLGASRYAMILGYALDGLLWEPLKAAGAVPATALTREHPLWNGAFWASYPPRPGSSGTNFMDCGDGVTLVMVWDQETVGRLDAFAADQGIRLALRKQARDLAASVEPPTKVAVGRRSPLNGRAVLPVIRQAGKLDRLARDIANPVSAVLLDSRADEARGFIPTQDRAVATVIVAHELIWDLEEQLVARGAFGVRATDGGLAGTMFLLVSRDESSPS